MTLYPRITQLNWVNLEFEIEDFTYHVQDNSQFTNKGGRQNNVVNIRQNNNA